MRPIIKLFLLTVFVVLLSCFSLSRVMAAEVEEAEIKQSGLGMNVSGTKDLPNVLYIVPWKENSSQMATPKISRLVNEIYSPVDPEVFTKQVKFYYQLTSTSDKKLLPDVSNSASALNAREE